MFLFLTKCVQNILYGISLFTLRKETPVNIDPIIPSILNVVSNSDINIESDLLAEQTKSIAQLLEENDVKEEND